MNENNILDNLSSHLIKLKKELKEKMDNMSKDSEIKSNFMIIKIGLNNLNNINLKNLDDLVKYSKVINEYFSSFFDEHYELIFLFGESFV